ncbi:T6SS effector BTH_I2691 family protein [Pragia fontium]|uniref:Toxin VasX N-terminal region domain-containing protein n=1 Tax=Pragia fontium DSM 5563 = ATCC 49100 TaxID=1122977 RepID=A0AAJ4WDT5_9GAMM|nr:T6SS effector BTH_I2691 family protein [Pragia fontium]SFD50470.1 hypothetical protein SAMN02745723_1253 [Pragia fontium DSM 5563 = ATCC 49100]
MSQDKGFVCDCQTRGLAILPVRYAVVPKSVKQKLPSWADHGWANSKGFQAQLDEEQYHYALRVLRQGFIYLYLPNLEEQERWRVFSVAKDGTLWKQPSALAAKLKDQSDCSSPGHQSTRTEFFCISEPEKCGQIWIAYSEHKWSENTLNKYAADPGLRMKEIKSSEWTAPSDKDDIAKATAESLNSVLDYCSDFDYGSFPDIDYGLSEPYAKVLTRDNKKEILASRDKLFNLTTGQPDDFSFISEKVETITSHHLFVKARHGNAANTLEIIERCTSGDNAPLLIALDDPIGIIHDLNDSYNELSGKLTQYTEELAYYYNAYSLVGSLKDLMENYDAIMDEGKAAEIDEPYKTRRLNRVQLRKIWMKEPVDPLFFKELDRITFESSFNDNEATYNKSLNELKLSVDNSVVRKKAQGMTSAEFILMDRWKKYQNRLDKSGLYNTFNQNYDSLQAKIAQLGELRCGEIVKWLKDNCFEQVLNDYDDNIDEQTGDLADAVEFKEVISAAISGINATQSGMALIDEWMDSTESGNGKNYLRRVLAFNQLDVVAEIDSIMSERNKADGENDVMEGEVDSILSQVKWSKIADLYKKAQGYANTQLRLVDQDPSFKQLPASWRPIRYVNDVLLVNFGFRFLFASYGPISKSGELMLLKLLHVGSLITVGTSHKVVKQLWDMRKNSRAAYIKKLKGISQVVDKRIKTESAEIKKAFAELEASTKASTSRSGVAVRANNHNIPARNGVIDVRLAFLVAVLEVWNLMHISEMLKNDPYNQQLQDKLTIAKFAVVGTTIETLAQTTKLIATDKSSLFQVLKVSGAVVSAGAGVLSACSDVGQIDKNANKNNYGLVTLYLARMLGNIGSSASGVLAALTYSTPAMEVFVNTKLADLLVEKLIQREVVGLAARTMLFRAIAMGAGIYISLAILAISALIYFLEDDEMEEWIDKSAFGLKRVTDYKDRPQLQQEAFEKALKKILGIEEPPVQVDVPVMVIPMNQEIPGLTGWPRM